MVLKHVSWTCFKIHYSFSMQKQKMIQMKAVYVSGYVYSTFIYCIPTQICIEFSDLIGREAVHTGAYGWHMDRHMDQPTVVLIRVIRFAISNAWFSRTVAFEGGVWSQVCSIPNRMWDMKKQCLSQACYSRLGIG